MARDLPHESIDFGSVDAVKLTGTTFSVATWINPDVVTGRQRVAACNVVDATSGLRGWAFGIEADEVRFTKFGVADMTTSTFTVTIGSWQFIAIAGTGGANVFYHLSAAGVLTTQTNTNSQDFLNGVNHEMFIGSRSNGTGGHVELFDGKLAEVAVWSVKLTQDQVLAYARGGPWRCGANPVFYAPLWGVAAPEPELSIGGVKGTLTGAAPQADHPPVGNPFLVAV